MSRTPKSRIICHLPQTLEFMPAKEEDRGAKNPVILTMDEYETIRLIDNSSDRETVHRQSQMAATLLF